MIDVGKSVDALAFFADPATRACFAPMRRHHGVK